MAVFGGLKKLRSRAAMSGWLMPTWLFLLSLSLSLSLPFLLLEESKGAEEVGGKKGLDRCS